ncbi:gasdermin-A2-like isoform X2 [Carcharodon carcharias]|uniref:gasdermin-A2-like isoform X2 n=1 Tax=Carcharodon carcharias TaxID=13397 RepID=UPI001B7F1B88|nr:gasdermin-A2-like isoform X2 [Carcharodon carcharias]
MFKKALQHLIEQIDSGGGLIPATSAYESEKFQPLHLAYRRKNGPFWRKPTYCPTEFELKHVLVDEDTLVPVQQKEMPFSFLETVDGLIKGKVKVNLDPVTGKVELSKTSYNTVQLQGTKQLYISVSELIESLKKRKLGRSWELIKNNYSGDLCIVTETLVSVEPITLKKVNKRGSEFYVTLPYISKAGTECSLLTERTLGIPKGTVLAYKVWDLTISEDDTLCISVPKKKQLSIKPQLCLDNIDVKRVESFEICCELKCLENVLKRQLLDHICQIIEDSELHSVLSDLLCDACAGIKYKLSDLNKFDTKGRECAENLLGICSEAQLQNAVENKLLKAVCLLIAALEDLPPAALQLLVQSLKMQILPQQLNMVTNIINDLEYSQVGQLLKVDTRGLPEAAFGITAGILNEIGIQMEREGIRKMRETSLCELSIALYCLEALSNH